MEWFLMKIAIECILQIQFHWNYSNQESKFFLDKMYDQQASN